MTVILRVQMQGFIQHPNDPDKCDMAQADKVFELNDKATNTQIIKELKAMLLDMRDVIKNHKPSAIIMPTNIITEKSNGA